MQRGRAILLSTLFCVSLTSPAGAALLTLTGSTLAVSVGFLPSVTVPQNVAGVPILVSSGGGSFTEPAGLFDGSATLPTSLFTGVPIINGFTLIVSNRTKRIAPGADAGVGSYYGIHRAGGGLGGTGNLRGTAFVNVLALFNLVIPLSGIGNTGYSSYSPGTPGAQVTVIGTSWTTGNATITGITTETPSGALANTVTLAALGFDNRTAGHRGVVQLVSPFKVVSHVAGNLPGYALQTLTFMGVPEPGTLALLAAGVAALVGYGLRRRRADP